MHASEVHPGQDHEEEEHPLEGAFIRRQQQQHQQELLAQIHQQELGRVFFLFLRF